MFTRSLISAYLAHIVRFEGVDPTQILSLCDLLIESISATEEVMSGVMLAMRVELNNQSSSSSSDDEIDGDDDGDDGDDDLL